MAVDGIKTAPSGGAGILRVLGECYCSLYSIPSDRRRDKISYKECLTVPSDPMNPQLVGECNETQHRICEEL